jgi:hypothetical protein
MQPQHTPQATPRFFLSRKEPELDFPELIQPREKEFNFIKYLLLTAIIVLTIALTIFLSNRDNRNSSEDQQTSKVGVLFFFKDSQI